MIVRLKPVSVCKISGCAKNSRLPRNLSWILVILWMSVIFFLSSQPAQTSDELSKGFVKIIIRIIERVYPLFIETSTTQSWLDTLNNIVREYAHAAVFLVLGFFMFNAFKQSGVRGLKAFAAAFVFCVVYALTDEIHQIFVPGRACELLDLTLDCAGSLVGLVLFALAAALLHLVTRTRVSRKNYLIIR